MKIKTFHYPPPIPDRNCDWSAIDYETYDAGAPIGFGSTEQDAIDDLLRQIADRLRQRPQSDAA
jgi:hypothetical protein